jgi:hypothetical protein
LLKERVILDSSYPENFIYSVGEDSICSKFYAGAGEQIPIDFPPEKY